MAERIEASQLAWADVRAGVSNREETRKAVKDIAWPSNQTPADLRLAVIRQLLDDSEGEADSRNFVRLMLPYERKFPIVEYLSAEAARRGWEEVTPSLVRSYARPSPDIPDADRPERKALEALHPGKTAAEVAFEVFLNLPVEDGPYAADDRRVLREDAWDLLNRLDSNGSIRASLLAAAAEPSARYREQEPIEVSLAACVSDLRLLPKTGRELSWLQRLREAHRLDRSKTPWWTQAAQAMTKAKDEDVPHLRMRHVEPIRWASIHQPAWLEASRATLLAELDSRLQGRPFNRRARAREGDPLRYERLSEWEPVLSRVDLIAILVIDTTLQDEAIIREMFRQADLDHDDKTTEYGGILDQLSYEDQNHFAYRALLYPPRPMSRVGDRKFIASRDMIEQSDRSLAHYHFHVQSWNSGAFTGPSPEDLLYATNHARQCLVLTAVGRGELAVDYYQPGGIVIDLGEIPRPTP